MRSAEEIVILATSHRQPGPLAGAWMTSCRERRPPTENRQTCCDPRHQCIPCILKETNTVTETHTETWLTQEAYDRLKAELDHLSGEGRLELARRIDAARQEGDLKENGGYHAAKDEQGKQEARIRQLQDLLRHAKVGEAPPDDGVVEPGMVVTARVGGNDMTFLLGSRESAGDTDLDVYSERSPLGAAINGKRAGETVSYTAPNGKEMSVELVSAKPFSG
jgi:transcription elongation factor GreA